MKYFKLYFDQHRNDLLVCEVQFIDDSDNSARIDHFYEVDIKVPTKTVYYGADAEQPKFVILGEYKFVAMKKDKLTIY